jgi:hypothetical protein
MLFNLTFTGKLADHILDAPRDTKLSKARRFFMYSIELGGRRISISYRFFKTADAADALIPKD